MKQRHEAPPFRVLDKAPVPGLTISKERVRGFRKWWEGGGAAHRYRMGAPARTAKDRVAGEGVDNASSLAP
jgi:hypothetical protein